MKSEALPQNERRVSPGTVFFRTASAIMLGLAMATAVLLVARRVVHCFRRDLFLLPLKSAVPLIFAGIAFACLQFAMQRTRTQMALGLLASAAFILWGAEQFLAEQSWVAFIDDIVVFIFVLDLSIVVYGHLKPRPRSVGAPLPLDASEQ